MSSGTPKFLNRWWNKCSAVSRAVGNPRRGISLQAFEKRSTATRMQVFPSELGRSVTKSIPMWDQGRRGMGRDTSLPTGRWRGVEDMAQTEQLRTYLMTSRDILGHQFWAWRSERVRWLPGCPEPGMLWTEPRRDCRWEDGMKVFPSGHPSGAGLLRVDPENWLRVRGRIRQIYAGKSVRLAVTASRTVGNGEVKPGKEQGPAGLSGVEPLCSRRYWRFFMS